MKGVNNQGGGPTDSLGPGLAGMSNRVHDREGRPQRTFRTGFSSPLFGCTFVYMSQGCSEWIFMVVGKSWLRVLVG